MSKYVVTATWDDVPHLSEQQKKDLIDSYPAHEKDARTKGIPILGSGKIFPIPEEAITCAPFPIPPHWVQIGGLDFGYDHPFGAARLAWDRDTDIIYVTAVFRVRQKGPMEHAGALKPWGLWLPWAWPHDGLQHDKGGSCEELANQYRDQGLNMLTERATFEDGGNGVEAGIFEMYDRMETCRFKVFSTCVEFFEEYRLYHRKDGKIVKLRDDVLSACRYAIMMLRHAVVNQKEKPLKYQKMSRV